MNNWKFACILFLVLFVMATVGVMALREENAELRSKYVSPIRCLECGTLVREGV